MGNLICRTPGCTNLGKYRGTRCYRCYRDRVEAGIEPDVRPKCAVDYCPDRRGWGVPTTPGYCHKHHKQVKNRGMVDPPPFVRPRRGCDVDGCPKEHSALGYCIAHYQRWTRYGTTDLGSMLNPTYDCVVCGETFKRAHHMAGRTIRCPEHRSAGRRLARARWAAANPELDRQIRQQRLSRRRAMERGIAWEYIDRLAVFARDGWACYLCGWQIDPAAKRPDPHSASLDHIVPISRDGSHTWDNVALACISCNQRKSAKLIVVEAKQLMRVPA